ncbi:MAG: hypothetical protein FD123_170 [Bacteroidetes bacterium]|nr:MAG: hypothetical protein FD123_170 [Bacteroidota bacterium]
MTLITEKINYRTTRLAELWSDEYDYCYLVFFEDAEVEEEDAVDIIKTGAQTFVGEKYVVLADIRKLKSMSNEARHYLAGRESERLHEAVAILVENTSTRLLANFFINFHKPTRPTRIFTSEEKAKAWLKQFLPGNKPGL